MSESTFPETIQIRTEPGLRAALADAARDEFISSSDFIRGALRSALSRRSYRRALRDGYKLRWASRSDLDRFGTSDLLDAAPAWFGIAAERQGEVVDAVVIVRGSNGRPWLAGPLAGELPSEITALIAERLIGLLSVTGEPVYAIPDDDVAGDRELLNALGFVPERNALPNGVAMVLRPAALTINPADGDRG